jgi:hypothetical protein
LTIAIEELFTANNLPIRSNYFSTKKGFMIKQTGICKDFVAMTVEGLLAADYLVDPQFQI